MSTAKLLEKYFKFPPSPDQLLLFEKMGPFLEETESDREIFILRGFAGTGKTTFTSALVKSLRQLSWHAVLLAPTGRSAKVLGKYTKRNAYTIHKKIYRQVEDDKSGNLRFERQPNLHENTLFIVDEASMINDMAEMGRESLLFDLVTFVFEGSGNKLLLIGDEAQLPPVKNIFSPALDAEHVSSRYHAEVKTHLLTNVMRQKQASGILDNATALRQNIENLTLEVHLKTLGYPDIFRMTGERILDGLNYAYTKYGKENTIVITRSNKNAVEYNRFIRSQINFSEYELEVGDLLMNVRNNYRVLSEDSSTSFLANGDFLEVSHLGTEEEMHGFRFQHASLQMVDFPDDPEIDTLILLDTLHSNSPSLGLEESKQLYDSVLKDYFWVKSKRERQKMLREDVYLNALQVKYAYALTCHKAQGGQWDAVFIDHGFLQEDVVDLDFMRWLYTAITRGVKEVFFINFKSILFT